jgi:hypothetical protein
VAKVFLHIGTMKSGSSFIQSACAENREVLEDAGIRYLDGESLREVSSDLAKAKREARQRPGAWGRLARKASASASSSLISNELLCPIPVRAMRRVVSSVAPHELEVIITVRDITKVVPSHWQERIQNGSLVGWDEFCEMACTEKRSTETSRKFWRQHDVVRVIHKWLKVLPQDRITIVTVPRPGSNEGVLLERFLAAMGVMNLSMQPASQANKSLGAASAELLLMVNAELSLAVGDQTHQTHQTPNYFVKMVLAKRILAPLATAEPRYALTPQRYEVLRGRAVELAAGIRASGIRIIGDVDEIVPGETAPEGLQPGEVHGAAMLEAAVHGLVGMCRQMTQDRNELERLNLGSKSDHAHVNLPGPAH